MTTKGPWRVYEGDDHLSVGTPDPNDPLLADMIDDERSWDECRANAVLMAAAPEMLAALRMVLDDPGLTAAANNVIRAAIEKATG